MRSSPWHSHTTRHYLWPMLAGIAVLFVLLAWSFARAPPRRQSNGR